MNVPALSESETITITPTASDRKWSFIAAGVLALIYLVTSILIARHRLFWYDEILTVIFSRQPSLSALWKALANGADGMPPLNYVVVRLFEHLPVAREVSARLPSALAMTIGMLITFDCARRLSDGLHGLMALSLLTSSVLPYYGYEARPYALYFMLASLALWIWANTSDVKTSSALVFGIVLFVAVGVHYYAVLCLVPYTTWELWNWKPRRVPSGKLIAGYLAVFGALVLLSQEILSLHRLFSRAFWSPPSMRMLVGVLDDLFPHILLPLVGVMVLAALFGPKKKPASATAMQPFEQLCWFFALIPLAGYVIAKLGTNAFYNRYFICLLPGITVAFSCLMWRRFRSSQWISIAALLFFAGLGLSKQLDLTLHPAHVRPLGAGGAEPDRIKAMLLLEDKIRPAEESVVISVDDLLGIEAHYYSKHPERYVLLLGTHSNNTSPTAGMFSEQQSPIRFWTLDDLKANAGDTILINPLQETLDIVRQAGYKPTLETTGDLQVVSVQ